MRITENPNLKGRKIILTKVLLKVRPEEKNYSGKVAEA